MSCPVNQSVPKTPSFWAVNYGIIKALAKISIQAFKTDGRSLGNFNTPLFKSQELIVTPKGQLQGGRYRPEMDGSCFQALGGTCSFQIINPDNAFQGNVTTQALKFPGQSTSLKAMTLTGYVSKEDNGTYILTICDDQNSYFYFDIPNGSIQIGV